MDDPTKRVADAVERILKMTLLHDPMRVKRLTASYPTCDMAIYDLTHEITQAVVEAIGLAEDG